jgi:hypothetical protein
MFKVGQQVNIDLEKIKNYYGPYQNLSYEVEDVYLKYKNRYFTINKIKEYHETGIWYELLDFKLSNNIPFYFREDWLI